MVMPFKVSKTGYVLTSIPAASRSMTMGATSAERQTSTSKDFSPQEEQL